LIPRHAHHQGVAQLRALPTHALDAIVGALLVSRVTGRKALYEISARIGAAWPRRINDATISTARRPSARFAAGLGFALAVLKDTVGVATLVALGAIRYHLGNPAMLRRNAVDATGDAGAIIRPASQHTLHAVNTT
tara:strand:+ start:441 stop:848 length:408 start_codon:yes stop_codon:yes gene_type:complete